VKLLQHAIDVHAAMISPRRLRRESSMLEVYWA
jgi:hypothetical protein